MLLLSCRRLSKIAASMEAGPIESALRSQLATLEPITWLQVINESRKHNVPAGSESHFKVFVVSAQFEGLAPLARHRLVNKTVASTLEKIHAFSIEAKTPAQFSADSTVASTPNCLGGSKK